MTETQKEYIRIDNEKFALISFACPWRHTPKIMGKSFCAATTELCGPDKCGIWHVVKAMVG